MVIKLMCFRYLLDEVKKLEKIIKLLKEDLYALQVKNFAYEREIKELNETLERYKIIVSNGYI